MKRVFLATLLLSPTMAFAWCLPGYTEAPDLCHAGLVYCLAPGQHAPTTCGEQQQQQSQQQAQQQAQQQSSTNVNQNTNNNSANSSSASSATGGTGIGIGGNSSATGGGGGAGGAGGSAAGGSATGGNAAGGSAAVKNSGNSDVKNSGNNVGSGGGAKVTVEGDNVQAQARNPVNTAFAGTQVTVQTDSCRTGFGVGGQAVAFGFTMSGTARDENCEVLKLNRELVILGFKDVAVELLRGDERVEAAFKRVESKDKRDNRNRDKVGYVELHDTYQAMTLVNDHGN